MEPPNQLRQYSPSDFLYGPTLGEGRFGTVIYAELKSANTRRDDAADSRAHGDASSHRQMHARQRGQGYAIKMIPKSEILRHNQIQAAMTEKHILSEILSSTSDDPLPGSDLFMKLFLCFHDASYLYLVLELCAGGTLLDLIQSRGTGTTKGDGPIMDVSWVRYYSCQILRAIEYLHQRGVVHRDITPQNIGLTFPKGEVKLGDFGAAAVFVKEDCDGTWKLKRLMPTGTPSLGPEKDDFIGTADYVSPEMIRGSDDKKNRCKDHTNFAAMDIWSFGCICYHMLVGKSPFRAPCDHLAFQNVLDYANGSEVNFPPFVTGDAKEIISLLLSIEPANRLGMHDGVIGITMSFNSTDRGEAKASSSLKRYQSIRDHPFFRTDDDTSFTSIESKSTEPVCSPAEPDWMAELNRGDTTLKSLKSIQFDL